MKFKLLIFIVISNIAFVLGQKKQYENIMNKVAKSFDKNYFTDSISAIRHSEYVIDSLNDFKRVVLLAYFPSPMWDIDYKFYSQKYNYNDSIFSMNVIGYLNRAKLYQTNDLNNLGFTIFHRFNSSSHFNHIAISSNHSFYESFIRDNKEKRNTAIHNVDNNNINIANNKNESYEAKISVIYDNTDKTGTKNSSASLKKSPDVVSISSPPIYAIINNRIDYIAEELVYNETDCYRLTKTSVNKSVYTEIERQRFEDRINDWDSDFFYRNYNYSEQEKAQQKNEFRQLVEYWANGETVSSQSYIIAKKDFAVLKYSAEIKMQTYQGQWFDVENIVEIYKQGVDGKYYQVNYSKLVRNYRGGFPNLDNYRTFIVRTPMNIVFSLDSVTKIPRSPFITYEDFCEKVDTFDVEMLSDWQYFEGNVWD